MCLSITHRAMQASDALAASFALGAADGLCRQLCEEGECRVKNLCPGCVQAADLPVAPLKRHHISWLPAHCMTPHPAACCQAARLRELEQADKTRSQMGYEIAELKVELDQARRAGDESKGGLTGLRRQVKVGCAVGGICMPVPMSA